MAKLTPWFNARTQPPVNGGPRDLYEYRCREHRNLWSAFLGRPIGMERRDYIEQMAKSCPHCEWRGVASPPKGKR